MRTLVRGLGGLVAGVALLGVVGCNAESNEKSAQIVGAPPPSSGTDAVPNNQADYGKMMQNKGTSNLGAQGYPGAGGRR